MRTTLSGHSFYFCRFSLALEGVLFQHTCIWRHSHAILEPEVCMTAIDPHDYIHPEDVKALEAVQAIPGLGPLMKSFMKTFTEDMLHGMYMGSGIRLGKEQLPEVYDLLPPICERLGVKEPELYLRYDPYPNAFTTGVTNCFVNVTTGLLGCVSEMELKAVLAHECGHIACNHVLYHTLSQVLLSAASSLLGKVTIPLELALLHWSRCSELSADRAGAICTGGCDEVVGTMLKLSGGGAILPGKINMDLYMKQADEYEAYFHASKKNKLLQYVAIMEQDHPLAAVRTKEITKWCASDDFSKIQQALQMPDTHRCPKCGALVEKDWLYCQNCGAKLDEGGA